MMSSHIALPRKGHLEALFHMFAYLKKHHNSEMVFDPSEPDVDVGEEGGSQPRREFVMCVTTEKKTAAANYVETRRSGTKFVT